MNIPNLLTIIRLIAVPFFVYFFYSGLEYGISVSFIIFLFAGLTDILDGYIARKYNLITRIGTILDPLADKLMLLTVLISICIKYSISIWIFIIVLLKELIMIIGGITLYSSNNIVVPANVFGKLSTLSFYIAITTLSFHKSYATYIVYAYVILTLTALVSYVINYVKIKRSIEPIINQNNIDKIE